MIAEIQQYLKGITGDEWPLEATADEKFGDYSSNLAFRLGKEPFGAAQGKRAPAMVARELVAKIKTGDNGKMFAEVSVAGPGFVNFRLSTEALFGELGEILKTGKKYGRQKADKPQNINVEYVSANPTGPLTMANGRGGFYGDTLANVLSAAGHEVTREYYINDAGNQVRLLGESIQAAEGKIPEKEEYYKGAYIKDLVGKTPKQAVVFLLKSIKASLKKAGITYDVWFSEEQNLHKKGELQKTLELLESRGAIEKKDGATWLGDGVVMKSDGNPTYFLADLAYHYDKLLKRKFDVAIDVWGADHHGYAERMKKGVAALGITPERLKIIIMQLVRLVRGGVEVKMSKRAGEFVTMDELLEEVGVDAARFFFLMNSAGSHMDFDLDLAKERSAKNPVYYCQYALVRSKSILAKLKIKNEKLKIRPEDLKFLITESELRLIKELVKFPDVIAQTAADYQAHRLTRYAGELARALHNFYEHERVVGAAEDVAEARIALVTAAKTVFENLFGVLGISAPEEM